MSQSLKPHWYSRGYLPHFDTEEPQLITFRLVDSLPHHVLAAIAESEQSVPTSEDKMERFGQIEQYLDRGHGAKWLQQPEIASLVQDVLLHFDGPRYRLHAWTVMPNHVHVLLTATDRLDAIVHSWKSWSAHEANRILGRKGPFWQREYFDRVIRDEEHFRNCVRYVEANPSKARLCLRPQDWKFGSAFQPDESTRRAIEISALRKTLV
jgi:putative DNA methylase